MDQSLRTQIGAYLTHLNCLIVRGEQLRDALTANPADLSLIAQTRRWQEDCGVTINQLSGGSKAHWLARAFSQAFLMRTADGQALQGAAPSQIVQQLLFVLGQAVSTLSHTGDEAITAASTQSPAPHRFDFVHDAEICPVLERAYIDGCSALDKGDFQLALMTYCGILEAIVTDALEHKGHAALLSLGAPTDKISDWSFETRLAVAEKTGLIRGGAARLPEIARAYRDDRNEDRKNKTEKRRADKGQTLEAENREQVFRRLISERDARRTGQVLHVIMRDLDPGR